MTRKDAEKQYWQNFYNDSPLEIERPSQFALEISTTLSADYIILDFGCGNGRDSIFFSQFVSKVICLDQSQVALSKIEHRKVPNIQTNCVDISNNQELLIEVFESIKDSPHKVLVYARFFLHSLDDKAYRDFFDTLGRFKNIRSFEFAFEYRNEKDKFQAKIYDNHGRWFRSLGEVTKDLEANHLRVVDSYEGVDLAVFGNENPNVTRLFGVAK